MSIKIQTDTVFINELNVVINEIRDIVNTTILYKDVAINDKKLSYDDYDKYIKKFKHELFVKQLNKLTKILSDRFGFKISIEIQKFKNGRVSSILMPNFNYRIINMALENLSSLFPKTKTDSVLWNNNTSAKEQVLYKTLKNITTSIKEDEFKIDLVNAKIYGLKDSEFIISLDFFTAEILSLSNEEITSFILFEVGNIFTYLEYIHTTSRSNFVLLDTFINERFDKNNDGIDALRISLAKSNKKPLSNSKEDMVVILQELELNILKTYNISNTGTKSVKIDFKQLSDIFVNRFGLGDIYSNALKKQYMDKSIVKIAKSTPNEFVDMVLDFLSFIAFIMSMLIMLILGLFVFIVFITVKIISFVLSTIVKFILNIFSSLFLTGSNEKIETATLIRRLEKIKLDSIRTLRKSSKHNKEASIENIENIKKTIKELKPVMNNIFNIDSKTTNMNYSYDVKLEDVMETLTENELHFHNAKFKNI